MPYAKEPLKSIYVTQRLFTSLVMCIWWTVYYGLLPRRYRPRPSWSIKCCISVNFMRRIYKVTELAGVTWGTRNPDEGCNNKSLKYTRFEWVDPLPDELRTGIIADPQVPFKRVGCFVWPKVRPKSEYSCLLLSPFPLEEESESAIRKSRPPECFRQPGCSARVNPSGADRLGCACSLIFDWRLGLSAHVRQKLHQRKLVCYMSIRVHHSSVYPESFVAASDSPAAVQS